MTVRTDNFPSYLQQYGKFCCWKYEERDGKNTKIPYNPRSGGKAQSNNEDTFVDFQTAMHASATYDGIGMGIFGRICGIDIDHCVFDGELTEMAKDIINIMDSYTEYSPSGAGVHIYFAVMEGFSYDQDKYYTKNSKRNLEVYIAGQTSRYLTVTGNTISFQEIADKTAEIQVILDKYMLRPERAKRTPLPAQPVDLSDQELIERAMAAKNGIKFSELWRGGWAGYKSQSEAVAALLHNLAFWTGRDPIRMDSLFRQSGLMYSKFDELRGNRTWGQIEIENAISACTESYIPKQENSNMIPLICSETDEAGDKQPVGDDNTKQLPKTSTAKKLMQMNLPPVRWIVKDLLPAGSSAIVAKSKVGKSWMVLDLLLTVAMGSSYMGHECTQCGVLYLALEDSDNRLQCRMTKVLDGRPVPDSFHYATEWDTLDSGFYDDMERWLKEHPDVKIVAVDVLQRIRGGVKGKETFYGADYREIGGLKRFFDGLGVSLILLHHTRKNNDSSDPYDAISGTNGIMGALDTVWVIIKDRNEETATLNIIGRDVEQQELTIKLNKDNCRWENLGSADWFAEERKRKEHEQNPIVITIKELLADTGLWRGKTSQLMQEALHIAHYSCRSSSAFGRKLKAIIPDLKQYDGIRYEPISNGTGSSIHVFTYGSEIDDQEEYTCFLLD